MLDSTVLTIGTALDRARDSRATVDLLVQGQWLSGQVLALDGHGAVLQGADGESAVVRLEQVSAVKVHPTGPVATAEATDVRVDRLRNAASFVRAHPTRQGMRELA